MLALCQMIRGTKELCVFYILGGGAMPFCGKINFLFFWHLLLMTLAALTFLITNATTYTTHVTILALFTLHILQLLYRKGASTLYAIINKITSKLPCMCICNTDGKGCHLFLWISWELLLLAICDSNIKKIMVLSEHEWIFLFELSILRFFYGGNLTVINSFEAKFSKKVVSAYFLQVQLSVWHLRELVVVSGFIGHICNL